MFDYDNDSPGKSDSGNIFWGLIAAVLLFALVIMLCAPNKRHEAPVVVSESEHQQTEAAAPISLPTIETESPLPAIVAADEPEAAAINPSPEESTVPLDIPAAIEELHEDIHERIHEDAETIVRHVEQDVTEAKSIIHRVIDGRRHSRQANERQGHHQDNAGASSRRPVVSGPLLARPQPRHHFPHHSQVVAPPITYFYDPAEDPSRFPYIRYWVE